MLSKAHGLSLSRLHALLMKSTIVRNDNFLL